MRTVLILDPTSGASLLATHQSSPEENEAMILAALHTYNIEPEVWHTTPEDAGDGLAQRAARDGYNFVIAAGGDGTLHAVARGLIGTTSTLAIIPMGTMNNIARSLKIPETVEEACAILAHGKTTRIDVGKINGHIFLEVAGIGLEAALFPAAEEIKSSGFRSTLHGIFEGLSTLFAFQPTRFTISFDGGRSRAYKAVQVSICNSPYYGARLQFAPKAVMNDGLLDVLVYRNFSKFEYLRHAITISQGMRPFEPKVTRRKIKSLHIGAAEPVEIHADGVPLGHTPATVTIDTGALRVRVPEEVATGPNVLSTQKQRTRILQIARNDTLVNEKEDEQQEEKGPQYVK